VNWKTLLFEEEPQTKTGEQPESQTESQAPQAAPAPVMPQHVTTMAGATVGSDEMVSMCQAILHDAVVKVGQCPYTEFSEALDSLAADMPDEALRFRAAMKVLKFDPAEIVASAGTVTAAIETQKSEKIAIVDKKWDREVTINEKRFKQLEDDIVAMGVKMQEMQKEKSELAGTIAVAKSKLTDVRGTMEQAYTNAQAAIGMFIQKLQTYTK
jgi:plastocyanin